MRYSLLQLVQRVLESLDSDEVNSIADTTESLAVANIVQENYFDIVGEHAAHDVNTLFHLDASTDNTKPCVMYLPSYISRVEELQYNVGDTLSNPTLRPLKYLDLQVFMHETSGLDTSENWVDSQVVELPVEGEFTFKYRNDVWPSYYTSPDDNTFIFDAYKSDVEDTLTSSRTYGIGDRIPVFQMTDTYIPDLDARHFQLLLNSSKAQAAIELKQIQNQDAERKARRNRLLAYKTENSTDPRSVIKRNRGYGRTR